MTFSNTMSMSQNLLSFVKSEKVDILLQFSDLMTNHFDLKTADSSHIFTTRELSKLWGFRSPEYILENHPHDDEVNCPTVECIEYFRKEDQMIMSTGKSTKVIALMCYADENWQVVLSEKYPVYSEDGSIFGIANTAFTVTDDKLINWMWLNARVDYNHFGDKNKIMQQIYTLSGYHNEFALPTRQAECLFYLLRGKTSKEIGKILHISFRTVEDHISVLKNKFNCSTKHELIEKSIYLGAINLIPPSIIQKLGGLFEKGSHKS